MLLIASSHWPPSLEALVWFVLAYLHPGVCGEALLLILSTDRFCDVTACNMQALGSFGIVARKVRYIYIIHNLLPS